MMTWTFRYRFVAFGLIAVLALAWSACGPRGSESNNANGAGDGGMDAYIWPDGNVDAYIWPDGGGGDGGLNCEPPDMLIVLDRTMSMHRQPNGDPAPQTDHSLSKWYLAVGAIEQVTAAFQERLRFGLELFPRDPGGDVCVTLTQRIDGITATNVRCEEGEVLVSPNVGTAADIDAALDLENTRLCRSTPIGAGLDTALTALSALTDPIRDQYVLLVTDGQDTCTSTVDPVERVQALAAAGIHSFIVGFDASGTGVDPATLNDMACAGMTAPDHAINCTQGAGGYVAVDAANGPLLFLTAGDGAELTAQIEAVASAVGCLVQ